MLDSNPDALWLVDRSMRLRAYNRSFSRRFLSLYGVEVYENMDILACLPEDEKGRWYARYQRAMEGQSFAFDEQFDIDNHTWYYEVAVTPVRDDAGEIRTLSLMAHNVTDRHRTVIRTKSLAARMQALLESAVRLNSSIRERDEVYRETMDLLAESIRFDTGSVQILEGATLEIVHCVGFPEEDRVVGLRFPLDGRFPNERVVQGKGPLVVADIRNEFPHFLGDAHTFESGHVRSWMGIPLIVEGTVMGMFTLDRCVIDPFGDEDVQVATALAHNAAVAIANARLYRQLIQANEKQETLLRELHHRVKNNMQLVASLMSLRSDGLGVDAQEVLHSLRTRILSLSAVHESLYRSERLDRVNLAEYTTQVVQEMQVGYVSPGRNIQFHLAAPDSLNCVLDRAIPFGLILGEILLNAVKHAFGTRSEGTVTISLSEPEPGTCVLDVRDDGVGFGNESANSFGMTLLDSLTRQIRGELQRAGVPNGGVRWVLTFDLDPVG